MRWGGERAYQSHRVKLVDCSAHGVGVEDAEPMNPGDQFVLYLQLGEVSMVLYTVCHCRPAEGGRFRIGAKLDGFITSHDADPDKVLASLLMDRFS
jgi:hypothetical protein